MITSIMRGASPHNASDCAVVTATVISKHEAHIDNGSPSSRYEERWIGVQREGGRVGREVGIKYYERARIIPHTLISRT
jgi:hypothetical protein